MIRSAKDFVVALSGGIGGAKLALGLSRVLEAGKLTVIANTGDDFQHLGLSISPDIDTLLYTLSDLSDPVRGWGRRDETWTFMKALAGMGGDTWFQLGDADLATHIERTRMLAAGETLEAVTDQLRRALNIASRIVPMTNDQVRTRLRTSEGWLDFQDYFVRRRCEPVVHEVVYAGGGAARPTSAILKALRDPGLRAVIICPSNPILSIEPILAVSGMRQALRACAAPVIAVTPLIAGKAVKGPTAKIMQELGGSAQASDVAQRYADIVDVFVVDDVDANCDMPADIRVVHSATYMQSLQDRERLATAVLECADRHGGQSRV